MLVKVASKDTETVINALIKHSCKLPQELYKSLTWDCGTEMTDHQRFTVATDIKVYFCGVSRTQARACDAVSKDGRRPPEVGLQEQASNRSELLRSKGAVVSDRGKGVRFSRTSGTVLRR